MSFLFVLFSNSRFSQKLKNVKTSNFRMKVRRSVKMLAFFCFAQFHSHIHVSANGWRVIWTSNFAVKFNQLWKSGSRCLLSNKLCRVRIPLRAFLNHCEIICLFSWSFSQLLQKKQQRSGEEGEGEGDERKMLLLVLPFPCPAAVKRKHPGAWSDGTLKQLQARFIIPKSSITDFKRFPL